MKKIMLLMLTTAIVAGCNESKSGRQDHLNNSQAASQASAATVPPEQPQKPEIVGEAAAKTEPVQPQNSIAFLAVTVTDHIEGVKGVAVLSKVNLPNSVLESQNIQALQLGDVITRFDETRIETTQDLIAALARVEAGSQVMVTVWRTNSDGSGTFNTFAIRTGSLDQTGRRVDA